MIGPRNSVVRTPMGGTVTMDEVLRDQSPFIDGRWLSYWDTPELWVDRLYEGYYGESEVGEMP